MVFGERPEERREIYVAAGSSRCVYGLLPGWPEGLFLFEFSNRLVQLQDAAFRRC
jgi:hypothetical protein